MEVTQELLRSYVSKRLEAWAAEPKRRLQVLAVLEGFAIDAYVRGAVSFVAAMAQDLKREWFRQFTPTIFLLGSPRRLCKRMELAHIAEDDCVAWTSPAPEGSLEGAKRLLKLLRSCNGPPSGTLSVRLPSTEHSAPARAVRLTMATAGLGFPDYLIHLSHLVCESAVEGALRFGDVVEIVHTDTIRSIGPSPLYVRVHHATRDGLELRFFGLLEEAEKGRGES